MALTAAHQLASDIRRMTSTITKLNGADNYREWATQWRLNLTSQSLGALLEVRRGEDGQVVLQDGVPEGAPLGEMFPRSIFRERCQTMHCVHRSFSLPWNRRSSRTYRLCGVGGARADMQERCMPPQ